MEPRGKRGQGALHALDEVRKVVFDVGYEDLGVVSVLGHMSVRCVQAEVVGEDGEQQGTKGGPLESPMVFGRGLETWLPRKLYNLATPHYFTFFLSSKTYQCIVITLGCLRG